MTAILIALAIVGAIGIVVGLILISVNPEDVLKK